MLPTKSLLERSLREDETIAMENGNPSIHDFEERQTSKDVRDSSVEAVVEEVPRSFSGEQRE